MYAKSLSSRLSNYIGVTAASHWGPKAFDMDIDAIRGVSPVHTNNIDFGLIGVPSATALGVGPINWTVTTIDAGISGNTIVANSSNGYLLITPGTVAASGYNIQAFKSNTVSMLNHQWFSGGTPNTTLATGRDYYFGFRMAYSCDTAWDGALYVGTAPSDTGLMTPATGALDSIVNGVGLHIGLTGAMNLYKTVSSTPVASTLTQTASTFAHTSSSFRARDFHDYFFWVHQTTVAGTGTTGNAIELYIDGKLAASHLNLTCPNLSTTSQYPTIEVLNGTAGLVTLAIASMTTGVINYHAPS